MNEEFKKYASTFDMNDCNIDRKYNHSLRVEKINEELAIKQNLSKHDILLAKLIGLLHDYGRFYQWTKYKTFNDKESIDHADYAVSELIDKKKITDFYKNEDDYQTIYEAIKYHNKYHVPKEVINKLMCDMIRDADKLDLLYMYSVNYFIMEDEGEISEAVHKQFMNHELIDYKNKKTKIDTSINGLSFVFDLNLNCSFKYLTENKILEKIYNNLNNKEKLKPYFDEVNKFIDEKLREED